jgi:hypothetical protein
VTLTSVIVLGGLVLAASPALPAPAEAQQREPVEEFRADSMARAYREAARTVTTPELERRIAARRAVQRSGYCTTLAAVIRHNALDALLSYIRMRLHLDFSLPHDQLFAYIPSQYKVGPTPGIPPVVGVPNAMTVVPLYEDRSFPPDPWKKE